MPFLSPRPHVELEATELVQNLSRGRGQEPSMGGWRGDLSPTNLRFRSSYAPPTPHMLGSLLAAIRSILHQSLHAHRLLHPGPPGSLEEVIVEVFLVRRTNPASSCPWPEKHLLVYILRDTEFGVLFEIVLLCSPGWPEIHYIELQGQLLPQLPEC